MIVVLLAPASAAVVAILLREAIPVATLASPSGLFFARNGPVADAKGGGGVLGTADISGGQQGRGRA